MRIAILGGTFNPVHNGHVLLASSVCETFGYDKLLFVPSFLPPHKIASGLVSVENRLEMLELACEADPRFEVERCEIDRGGISYTWETVCFIEEKYHAELEGKIDDLEYIISSLENEKNRVAFVGDNLPVFDSFRTVALPCRHTGRLQHVPWR